jgi:GNAT superfamily N-acetyltransferase
VSGLLRFYARDAAEGPPPQTAWPGGIEVSVWHPRDGAPPPGLPRLSNQVWRVFDRLGVFATRECGVMTARADGRIVHRALVSPRWFRFPDMDRDDLQIGAVFTDPAWRGRGLAKAGIAEIHKRWEGRFRRMWYIVEASNLASIKVIEACGYRLAGTGERKAPLGFPLAARYRLESEAG